MTQQHSLAKTKETEHWSALMQRAQQGDAVAYSQLLQEITPTLRKFLLRRLFHKENMEDVVQEILLAIHSVRHTYRPEQPFDRWLYGIAKHKLLDALRRYYRRDINEILDETDETFSLLATNNKGNGLANDLTKAMAQLNEKQRKIIVLAKIEG